MTLTIDNETYNLEIVKKRTTKNIYIRVKDDLTIYITCNSLTSDKKIREVINANYNSIKRMLDKAKKKKAFNESFYYLGKKYDLVYTEFCDLTFGKDKVFVNKNFDLDKWKKKEALRIFSEHLEMCYQNFSRKIPHPRLRLRKMTTRWGVCNVKTKVITLNTELLTKELGCLDYVIYHELSHLVEANHSKKFWAIVKENCPDYSKWRKLTNKYGEEE